MPLGCIWVYYLRVAWESATEVAQHCNVCSEAEPPIHVMFPEVGDLVYSLGKTPTRTAIGPVLRSSSPMGQKVEWPDPTKPSPLLSILVCCKPQFLCTLVGAAV